jgi:hypothetical protein
MWGALRIGVALLTIETGHQLLPPTVYHSGMTLVVRVPDGKKAKLPIAGTPAAPMVKGSAERSSTMADGPASSSLSKTFRIRVASGPSTPRTWPGS